MTSDPLVDARALAVRYGDDGPLALDGLDLSVQRGELISVIGPSGSGKSTLLRAVAGLVPVTGGDVVVAGLAPAEARRARVAEAFVFQDATLLPWRTLEANVRLPLELLRVPAGQRGPRVDEALTMVGLREARRRYPAELSGGMRMRASLARALVTHPELLLLDEPFGALDELNRQRLNEELLDLWAEQGWTGIGVTHSVHEAVFLSSRVLVMTPGPGRIAFDRRIDLPYPRTGALLEEPAYLEHVAELSARLREAAEHPGVGP